MMRLIRGGGVLVLLAGGPALLAGQDTTMVQGGIYRRPFIAEAGRTAVGGYLEANAAWSRTDGVSEGPTSDLQRFNIFLFSSLGPRLRFTSELEFESGGEEIRIETAVLDFELHPALVLRGGVLLPPIGAFNVNHDGPRYEFVARPIVATEIIPATLSEAGFGAFGRFGTGRLSFSWDAYLTNGLNSGVVLNDQGRTRLASGKGISLFEDDENSSPALSGRVAARHPLLGELGLSHYRGIWNVFRLEGETVDDKRWLSLTAVDLETAVGPVDLRGEVAFARIDLPPDLRESLGDRQWGVYLDAVTTVLRPEIRGLVNPEVRFGVRLERADFNQGRFSSTGRPRFDDRDAVSFALSFRPVPETVFRLNYRLERFRDLQGNPAQHTAAVQAGVATYF